MEFPRQLYYVPLKFPGHSSCAWPPHRVFGPQGLSSPDLVHGAAGPSPFSMWYRRDAVSVVCPSASVCFWVWNLQSWAGPLLLNH